MTKYRIVKQKKKIFHNGYFYSIQKRTLGIFWREIGRTVYYEDAIRHLQSHKRFEELPKKEIVYTESL